MDDLTNMAVWFSITMVMINVVFTWLTLTGGPMALTVPSASAVADLQRCSSDLNTGHYSPSALNNDVTNSYTCSVSPIFAFVGGWQIALSQVFSGGVFDVPLNPDATDVTGDNTSSLGWLFNTFLLPLFLILQALAILDIAYRVAIALSSAAGAVSNVVGSIVSGILGGIGGLGG